MKTRGNSSLLQCYADTTSPLCGNMISVMTLVHPLPTLLHHTNILNSLSALQCSSVTNELCDMVVSHMVACEACLHCNGCPPLLCAVQVAIYPRNVNK